MIVLTGATGFLGACLARTALAAGHPVRAIRREGGSPALAGEDASRIEWVTADLHDPPGLEEAFDGADAVIHAAALVSFRPGDRDRLLHANAEGTANVVNAALHAGVPRLVHVSSTAAVGRKPDAEPDERIDETWPWEWNAAATDYALSKHLAEREAWRGAAEGLDLLVVNPGTILGGGFWDRGTAAFFPRVDAGLRWWTDGGTGFVDVRDAARMTLRLLEREAFGERYLLVGENMAWRELFARVADALGVPRPSRRAGPVLLGLLARLEAWRARFGGPPPQLSPASARLLGRFHRYDGGKAARSSGLDYRPLAETIRETAALYRATAPAGHGLLSAEAP